MTYVFDTEFQAASRSLLCHFQKSPWASKCGSNSTRLEKKPSFDINLSGLLFTFSHLFLAFLETIITFGLNHLLECADPCFSPDSMPLLCP
jgi:hypothetical protein